MNGVPQNLLTVKVEPKLLDPPTTRQLKEIIETGGVKKLIALYTDRKAQDPQPFTKNSLVEVTDWLLNRKQYNIANELCRLFLDSYPDSVRANYALANVAEQSGDTELAKAQLGEMLRLINDDPDLDYRTRKRFEQIAKQELLRLR